MVKMNDFFSETIDKIRKDKHEEWVNTEKFNDTIAAFAADFLLAVENPECYALGELDKKITEKDERMLSHIDLLNELDFLLRNGKAHIVVAEDEEKRKDFQ